jgi:hypothetical protein
MGRQLPDVYNGWGKGGAPSPALQDAGHRERLAAIMRVRDPADVLRFGIEHLCRMVVELSTLEEGSLAAKAGAAFAQYEMVRLLKSEKLLSKPGSFNFAIFSEAPDAVELGSDTGDVGEDVIESIESAAGEDGGYDPFSLEGMDYDGINDEPA